MVSGTTAAAEVAAAGEPCTLRLAVEPMTLRRWSISADTELGRGRRKKERPLLSARDIAALNRARNVLKRVEDAAWKRSLTQFDPYARVSAWDLGRLSDAASVADDAIFHVLSTARHNCHVGITDAQLAATETGPKGSPRTLNPVPNGDSSQTDRSRL